MYRAKFTSRYLPQIRTNHLCSPSPFYSKPFVLFFSRMKLYPNCKRECENSSRDFKQKHSQLCSKKLDWMEISNPRTSSAKNINLHILVSFIGKLGIVTRPTRNFGAYNGNNKVNDVKIRKKRPTNHKTMVVLALRTILTSPNLKQCPPRLPLEL